MTDLEQQQQIVNLLETALASAIEAGRIDQRLSHERHPCPLFAEVKDKLQWLLDLERTMLKRLQTIGR